MLKAIMLGVIGAIAVPFVMRNVPGLLRPWLDWHVIHLTPGRLDIMVSIPIFLIVTLFAWAFFAWSDR